MQKSKLNMKVELSPYQLLKNEIRPSCQLRLSMVMYKNEKWQKQFEALKIMWSDHVDALGWGYYIDRDIENSLYYSKVKGYYCAQPFQRMFLKYNGNEYCQRNAFYGKTYFCRKSL